MNKTFENIINEGKKNGKKLSEINAELKAAGATFHLDYTMTPDGPQTGWSEKEMAEGFIPAEDDRKNGLYEIASDGKPVRLSTKAPGGGVYGAAVPVMERDESRAGTTITVGSWQLTYDERGYCCDMSRVHG